MTDIFKKVWRKLRIVQPFNRRIVLVVRGLTVLSHRFGILREHVPYIGVVELPLPNGKKLALRSYGDDYILNQTYWNHQYEPETSSHFFRLAADSKCTFDIGAHIGFYALLAGHANDQGNVFAFEPIPRIYQRLEENIRLNKLPHVRAVPSALGNQVGSANIFYQASPDVPSNSSLRRINFSDPSDPPATLKVALTTLDHFAEQNGIKHVDLIKMDTEGTELDVLKGMVTILSRDQPVIICEILQALTTGTAIEELLGPLGYHFYLLKPEGLEPATHIVGHPQWWNYLFTTKDHGI